MDPCSEESNYDSVLLPSYFLKVFGDTLVIDNQIDNMLPDHIPEYWPSDHMLVSLAATCSPHNLGRYCTHY